MTLSVRTMVFAALLAALVAAPLTAHADRASAHYHKAMAHKRAGRIADAIKALKEALQEREDYAAVHYSIGILYRQRGDHLKAIYHLERGAKLDSGNGQMFYSLGLAYHAAGRKDEALRTLKRAAELSPKDPQVLAQVGVLMIRRDPNEAIGILEQVVRLKPRHADYLHQLGLAYRKATTKLTGKANDAKRMQYLKKAEKHLLQAASLKDSAEIEFDLGAVYRRLEKTTEAIRHYENAIRLNPKMAAAHWDLAHMYTRDKRHEEAVHSYNAYLKLRGNSADAKIARQRIKELKAKQGK